MFQAVKEWFGRRRADRAVMRWCRALAAAIRRGECDGALQELRAKRGVSKLNDPIELEWGGQRIGIQSSYTRHTFFYVVKVDQVTLVNGAKSMVKNALHTRMSFLGQQELAAELRKAREAQRSLAERFGTR